MVLLYSWPAEDGIFVCRYLRTFQKTVYPLFLFVIRLTIELFGLSAIGWFDMIYREWTFTDRTFNKEGSGPDRLGFLVLPVFEFVFVGSVESDVWQFVGSVELAEHYILVHVQTPNDGTCPLDSLVHNVTAPAAERPPAVCDIPLNFFRGFPCCQLSTFQCYRGPIAAVSVAWWSAEDRQGPQLHLPAAKNLPIIPSWLLMISINIQTINTHLICASVLVLIGCLNTVPDFIQQCVINRLTNVFDRFLGIQRCHNFILTSADFVCG